MTSLLEIDGYCQLQHARQVPGRGGKLFNFDAVFPCPTGIIVALLRRYDEDGYTFPENSVWHVHANVTKPIPEIDPGYTNKMPTTLRMAPLEYDLVGDIYELEPAPHMDPNSESGSVPLNRRQLIVHVSGITFEPDKKTAKFRMEPEPYVSFVYEANKALTDSQPSSASTPTPPAGRPEKLLSAPCPIMAQVPDVGRYRGRTKPIPLVENKYVALTGRLMNVARAQDDEAKALHFDIDVTSIAFLGVAPVNDAVQTTPVLGTNEGTPALKKLRRTASMASPSTPTPSGSSTIPKKRTRASEKAAADASAE